MRTKSVRIVALLLATPASDQDHNSAYSILDWTIIQYARFRTSKSKPLPRLYDALIAKHLAGYRQMVFISGPRQVGKTTTAKHLSGSYLDWDNPAHRKLIATGPDAVATHTGLDQLSE